MIKHLQNLNEQLQNLHNCPKDLQPDVFRAHRESDRCVLVQDDWWLGIDENGDELVSVVLNHKKILTDD